MSSRSVLNTDEAGQQVQDTNVERKMEDDADHSLIRLSLSRKFKNYLLNSVF